MTTHPNREVVLDTETTGLDPSAGHRIVEIGCLELVNHVPTGETFHCYVDPERDMREEAFQVHGLSAAFLAEHDTFQAVAEAFVTFLADSPLVIHNAAFDLRFVNAELQRLDLAPVDPARAIDTVDMARRKFPGAPANLDALCRRFDIDISDRQLHGALKDARLLAEVYLELIGGRQQGMDFAPTAVTGDAGRTPTATAARPPRAHAPTADELAEHERFLEKLTDPIWQTR